MDLAATSTVTRELLGWTPVGPTLVEDIEGGRLRGRRVDDQVVPVRAQQDVSPGSSDPGETSSWAGWPAVYFRRT